MLTAKSKQPVIDFYTYPPIGGDDWRYTFQTAMVRALEMQMLSRAALLDMANAESFEQAADLLSGSEYALPRGGRDFAEVEEILQQRRAAVRELFSDLMLDEPVTGMNPTETDQMMGLIKKIREEWGMTVLVVEHDMRAVMGLCDELTVISFGKKLAEGKPEEIKNNKEVIEAYLGKEEMPA